MAVGVLEAEPAVAEVDAPRDAGVDHPLQRAIDRGAADPRVLAADQIDEIVGAEVPLLPEEDVDDEVALAGAAPAGRPVRLDELGGGLHGRPGPELRTWTRTNDQTLNDEPQPQVDLAFGFLIVNPPPMLLSTKSTSAPLQIAQADRIDEQTHAVDLEHLVGLGVALALVDHQAVLEARAAAALDEHPQAGARLVLLGQQLGDLLRRRFGDVESCI